MAVDPVIQDRIARQDRTMAMISSRAGSSRVSSNDAERLARTRRTWRAPHLTRRANHWHIAIIEKSMGPRE
jgi:hypothetical protein